MIVSLLYLGIFNINFKNYLKLFNKLVIIKVKIIWKGYLDLITSLSAYHLKCFILCYIYIYYTQTKSMI